MNDVINHAFANTHEEEDIYPLTVSEIADAQRADKALRKFFKKQKKRKSEQVTSQRFQVSIIEDVQVLTDDKMKMIIPPALQQRTIAWYHHYLQHPGMKRLKETLHATMEWTGMRTQVKQHVKTCKSCQQNKQQRRSYGHVPEKLAIVKPWETLCVDLIGPYTLKGKDGTIMDFMCLTMIDPATSWFEMVELPVVDILKKTGDKYKSRESFNKTSAMISRLANQAWLC